LVDSKLWLPKDEEKATHAAKLEKAEGLLDFREEAVTLHNKASLLLNPLICLYPQCAATIMGNLLYLVLLLPVARSSAAEHASRTSKIASWCAVCTRTFCAFIEGRLLRVP
jgi:methionyl-tRNA formyltransferase